MISFDWINNQLVTDKFKTCHTLIQNKLAGLTERNAILLEQLAELKSKNQDRIARCHAILQRIHSSQIGNRSTSLEENL